MEHVQSDRAFLKHCSIEGMVVETQSESKVVFFASTTASIFCWLPTQDFCEEKYQTSSYNRGGLLLQFFTAPHF